VYFNIRPEGGRQCILVLMGATADGKKELIAIQDGQRESEQSWKELLLDVQSRGLTIEPKLAIGDAALGFWKAVRQRWSDVLVVMMGLAQPRRSVWSRRRRMRRLLLASLCRMLFLT
jgi:transposase-like protein